MLARPEISHIFLGKKLFMSYFEGKKSKKYFRPKI